MNYKDVIESRYNRKNWLLLLRDIFGSRAKFWNAPYVVETNSQMARQALWLGTISLSDEQTIAIYEVELAESVDIERNRRGIRDMLLTQWRNNGNAGAFMFCYRENESVLRFSYVSESWKFADDGTYQKESTDTRRFTYLLGEGHRSRTAIQQFETLKGSAQTLKDLTKAFSVDAVSDMFFRDYKAQYANIIFYITGKRMVKKGNKWEEIKEGRACRKILDEFSGFADPEKAVRDYVKKLMGRLVFLQFLQKKGWLGVPLNKEWGSGDKEFIQNLFAKTRDKDNFIDDVLEVLFNDLNTERKNDISQFSLFDYQFKIPYLNGGLFERDATDETRFPLPAKYMEDMLEFFSRYNFTIDENDPNDAEVGVDPEMLGRIFENLLEDNKDKGAFYTPKEIVQYMCRESLIAYLQTDVKDEKTKEAIRQFVTTHDASVLGPKASPFRGRLEEALREVKICDPAIGSGAFPMGLLKELYLCRSAIEGLDDDNASEIKKHIIQHNIYGVDIEKGAVDIARLRFWLSLIVDEKTPHALPNLDFKIMQGNSLLEQYKGVDLSAMTQEKNERGKNYQTTMFDDMLDVYRRELREMLSEYYQCTDHKEKKTLRKRIINNVKKQLKEQSINIDFGDLDLSGNDQFFLWHTWFHDVFSQGGFDIVIGNPPYVVVKKKYYPSYEWNSDLYKIFYEIGLKELINDSGILSYITPKFFLVNKDDEGMRKYFINEMNLVSLTLCNPFDVVTENVITFIKKGRTEKIVPVYKHNSSKKTFKRIDDLNVEYARTNPYLEMVLEISSQVIKLLSKIESSHSLFKDITKSKRGAEVSKKLLRCNDAGLLSLIGMDVKKYSILCNDTYLNYEHKEYKRLKTFFNQDLIYLRRVNSCIEASTSDFHYGFNKNVYGIQVTDREYRLYYVLAILNAKVVDFYYKKKFSTKKEDAFPEIQTYLYEQLPIPHATQEQQKQICDIVSTILQKKSQKRDTSNEESYIDMLVYHLYSLSYDDIMLIDPETPITREEYEKEQ